MTSSSSVEKWMPTFVPSISLYDEASHSATASYPGRDAEIVATGETKQAWSPRVFDEDARRMPIGASRFVESREYRSGEARSWLEM